MCFKINSICWITVESSWFELRIWEGVGGNTLREMIDVSDAKSVPEWSSHVYVVKVEVGAGVGHVTEDDASWKKGVG